MDQKVILVTGGNRGIGLEICRQLAKLSHKIILGSRDLDKGVKASKRIKVPVVVKKLDVTDGDDIINLSQDIESEFGRLDVLINNAGIYIGKKGVIEADLNEVKQTMDTNFYGPWNISQAMLPLLRKSKNGRIINISSGMGARSDLTGGYAGYRMSKVALNALTIQMSNELKGEGISVNAVSPGWVRTDMGGMAAPRSVKKGAETAVWLATVESVPTGKFLRDKKEIEW